MSTSLSICLTSKKKPKTKTFKTKIFKCNKLNAHNSQVLTLLITVTIILHYGPIKLQPSTLRYENFSRSKEEITWSWDNLMKDQHRDKRQLHLILRCCTTHQIPQEQQGCEKDIL